MDMVLTAVPPTTAELLADWTWRPGVVIPLAAAAAGYLWGAIRVGMRHPARPWPWGRAAAFLGGLGVVAVATLSAVGRYSTAFFWVHMAQHLMLIMVAPALLIHGRPLILAMHATRNPWHTRIKRLLRSRVVTVLTCPLVAIPLYAGVVAGTHLTSFNNLVITSPAAAGAEEIAYLVVGYLYLLSGFGEEPIRWRLSRPVKMLVLVLSMPIDTFTGITLLMTTANPWSAYPSRAWGPDIVTDVHYGGAMMWVGGDTIMIALVLTALIPWVTGRSRGSARMRWVEDARRTAMDRYAAHLPEARPSRSDVDDDESRLDAYNAWLAAMADQDRRQGLR